uniref:Kinesin motor domain-containing protein n=1 Tax=Peronospora matthiolae TaxID=2874970 RepID=A0AAV1TIR3_9STRA
MPRLVPLLRQDATDDAVTPRCTTAEELFASRLDSPVMCVQRKAAAAQYSASFVAMSTLDTRSTGIVDKRSNCDVIGNTEQTRAETCSIDQCVDRALLVARAGKHVLFLVRDPKAVTKRLLFAVTGTVSNTMDVAAEEVLHRVCFRQCRSVYELLQELDHVETRRQKQGTRGHLDVEFVALGPLCDFFSGFETAAGITATGAGLKRLLELAVKRLRATTCTQVSLISSGSY